MERRPSWDPKINDNAFRETIEMRRLADGKTVFINELSLEHYMKGLAEATNTTPTEKQKAVGILARTYAAYYMDPLHRKFPGMPYDGSDDPAIFQKYLGKNYEDRNPTFSTSVDATAGMVVTYNGQLVKTPYFSQSDGRTRSAEEVWGWTNTPYLQSVSDPWCQGMEMKGHGVGLSGCGSDAQARAGKKYHEIIKYYYQGVEIKNLSQL